MLYQDGGIMAPGDIGSSGKTTVNGSYTINSGTVSLDIGGITASNGFSDAANSGKFDNIAVSGTLTLGGYLDVGLINGPGGTRYVPSKSVSFQIMTASNIFNSFTNPLDKVMLNNDPFFGSMNINFGTSVVYLDGYAANEWQGGGANAWGSSGASMWTNSVDPNAASKGVIFGSAGAAHNAVSLDASPGRTVGMMIFNTGNYTLNGAGVLTLDNGAAAATIAAQSGSQTIATAVTLNSNLTVTGSTGASLQISGAINGPGKTLTMTNAGTLILSGSGNSYGNTVIGGMTTVAVGNGGTTGNLGSGSVTNSGTLAFNRSDAVTFGGTVSGTGCLNQQGTGSVALTGPNTFTGAVAIQSGTLSAATLNSVVSGSASSSLGAPTTVANGAIAIGSGANTGTLLYTGAGETTDRVIGLSGSIGGAIIDQSGSGLLKFTAAPTAIAGTKTLTLQGSTAGIGEISAIIGNGSGTVAVAKRGSGTWTLSGANTYTGATAVNGGILVVGGSLNGTSSVTVDPGATLASIGANNWIAPTTASGTSVTINGTLSPGGTDLAPINFTLSGGAKLAFNNNSTLRLDLALDGSSDTVSFGGPTGDFLAKNGTVTLALNGSINYTASYRVFSNVTTAGFTFDTITGFNSAAYQANVALVGNNYLLTFAAVPEPGALSLVFTGLGLMLTSRRLRRRESV